MISAIQFVKDGNVFNYLIPRIDVIGFDTGRNIVTIGLTGVDDVQEVEFDSPERANEFYQDCLGKIDAFYIAMMPAVSTECTAAGA